MRAKRKYSNNDITVFWRAGECIHASICYTKLPLVFNPRRRPWVTLNNGSTQEIIDVVNECPTRALTFMWNDADKNAVEKSSKVEKDIDNIMEEFAPQNNDDQPVEIKIMRNGPVIITGNFKIFDDNGCMIRPVKMVSLCRCGYSHNQPYCDGSHFRYQFQDKKED